MDRIFLPPADPVIPQSKNKRGAKHVNIHQPSGYLQRQGLPKQSAPPDSVWKPGKGNSGRRLCGMGMGMCWGGALLRLLTPPRPAPFPLHSPRPRPQSGPLPSTPGVPT